MYPQLNSYFRLMENTILANRNSFMELGSLYFFTATINGWNYLLENDAYKNIIIDSLTFLHNKGKISVYAFVIMPNHIHIIWQLLEMNGKENPRASFLKFTAHAFKQLLQNDNPKGLEKYSVIAENKKYEFWQRDSFAFNLTNKDTAFQKLAYIHANPLAKHWSLSKTQESYKYSSAKYYLTGENNFSFLSHIMDVF